MAPSLGFVYKPLEDPENQLRLLRLAPMSDDHGETLHGTLHTFCREDVPPYRPVSYTWGTQEASSELLLQDPGEQEWHHFPIRPNLEALLKQFRAHFRQSLESEFFWVDAICINQGDDGEKGHQVRNMDEIYRYRGVAIWLGEPSHNSALAMDLVDQFDKIMSRAADGSIPPDFKDMINEFMRNIDDDSWQALYDLICRPWFSRRWVVQEYVLSDYKHFWVGRRAAGISKVMGLAKLLCLQPRYLDVRNKKSNYCRVDPNHVHELLTPNLDPVERLLRLSKAHLAFRNGETSELTLERLLDKFSGFSSYDPRDGIYAFISMASDITVSEWFPDYSSTNKTIDVYASAAMHIMKTSGQSDIICRRAQLHRQRQVVSSVSNASGWVPWFGPQTVNFGAPNPDREDESHPSQEHTHELHGYNTQSLTTFGQPSNRLKRGVPGWVGHAICGGCGKDVPGNGVQCTDCMTFHYCKECAKTSDISHDPSHRFVIHNGEVYHASGGSVVEMEPKNLRLCSCPMPDCFARVDVKAIIVDTLNAIGPESTAQIFHLDGGVWGFTGDFNKWAEMPGMKEHFDENGIPDEMFCRTITGNRMVTRRRVHHLTTSTIETVQKFIYEASKNSKGSEAFEEVKGMQVPTKDLGIHESFEIMLSHQRKFMTTDKTFGLVPRLSRPGDKVAIIIGCSVPVVIREVDFIYKGEKVWTLIGECYIDGLMDGEFMEGLTEGDTPEDITLV